MTPAIHGRVLVVAAHPDDETIGMGGQLGGMRDVFVAHITDGAPMDHPSREEYAAVRRTELLAALEVAGLGKDRAHCLGVVDQQAARGLARTARDLALMFREIQPDAVYTHAYEGGHPDHDAASFAVRCAARLVERAGRRAPEIFEFTSYHNGDPRGLRSWMRVGEFLRRKDAAAWTAALPVEARLVKRRMFECYASQRHMLEWFPIALERTRRAPQYDYREPPHDGRLFYEDQDWGWDGPRWRRGARAALDELDLSW